MRDVVRARLSVASLVREGVCTFFLVASSKRSGATAATVAAACAGVLQTKTGSRNKYMFACSGTREVGTEGGEGLGRQCLVPRWGFLCFRGRPFTRIFVRVSHAFGEIGTCLLIHPGKVDGWRWSLPQSLSACVHRLITARASGGCVQYWQRYAPSFLRRASFVHACVACVGCGTGTCCTEGTPPV